MILYLHQIQLLRYLHIHSIFGKAMTRYLKTVKSICHVKIGSRFSIYCEFYFKHYHLESPFSRSYCSQVFSRTTALKAEGQRFTGILQKSISEKYCKIQSKPPLPDSL